MQDLTEIIRVKESVADELFRIPGVIGVGVGLRIVGGEVTDEVVIRVDVAKKKRDVPPAERIPPEIRGFKTDVVERQYMHCNGNDQKVYYPVLGGAKLDFVQGGPSLSGTLGAIVHFPGPNEVRAALSTVHGQFTPGALAFQGPNLVGKVSTVIYDGEVDACLIPLVAGVPSRCRIVEIGPLGGIRPAQLGMSVEKRGWVSGLTDGWVVTLAHEAMMLGKRFHNQIVVRSRARGTPMALRGDSGSIGVTREHHEQTNHAIGMVIAVTTGNEAVLTPISRVLQRLGVTLCTSDPPEAKFPPDLIGRIIAGVIQGGGGIIITPGGIIKPIPPRGLSVGGMSLSEGVDQILSLLSVGELAQTVDDPAVRDRLARTALEGVIERARGLMPNE